jgi:Holliday junction resolvase
MKAEISKELKRLEDYGFDVFSFGDKRSLRRGQKGWLDNVILNNKYLIFIETKTTVTKDKLSLEQKKLASRLSNIAALNKTVYYIQLKSLQEAKNLVDRILQNKL